jgi:hypothetical protein
VYVFCCTIFNSRFWYSCLVARWKRPSRIKHWRKHGGAPPEGVGQAVGQAAAILRKANERRRGGMGGRFGGRGGRDVGRGFGGRGGRDGGRGFGGRSAPPPRGPHGAPGQYGPR